MLSCLRDTRMSITGVNATAFCPANNEANLAEKDLARPGGKIEPSMGPRGFFCLKSGGTSE